MHYFFLILNFFDQRAIENTKVLPEKKSLNRFNLIIRFVQFVLLYLMYFLIAKAFQFISSLFFQIPIESVLLSYYVIPLLFFMEIGLSKLDSVNLINFLIYALRALMKFGIIYCIDKFLTFLIL